MSTTRRATSNEPYQEKPDTGSVHSTTNKKSAMSPDYFGSLTFDVTDMTNITRNGNLITVKFNGWKKTSNSGKTFLSLAVNRYVGDGAPSQSRQNKADDFDPPF